MQVSKTIDRISMKLGTGEACIESYEAKSFLKGEKLKYFYRDHDQPRFSPQGHISVFIYIFVMVHWHQQAVLMYSGIWHHILW
jgi:hypothetical protein